MLKEVEGKLTQEKKYKTVQEISKYIIREHPSFGAIAPWCPYFMVEDEEIACTDGYAIMFGNKYFELPFKQQVGVFIHEVLHIALCHRKRGKNKPDSFLWNVACDGIINNSIKDLKGIELPEKAITIEFIFNGSNYRSPESWTAESLYEYLENNKDLRYKFEGYSLDLVNKPKYSESELPDYIKEHKNLSGEYQEDIWERRIERASQMSSPFGLFRKFGDHFFKPKTEWKTILSQYMISVLGNQAKRDYGKPGRRSLSLGSEIYTPSIKHNDKGIKTLGVVIDTSGSINQFLLNLFASEIDKIQKITKANINLIFADAEVAAKYFVRADGRSFISKIQSQEIKPVGGGGTDFRPALSELENNKVDLVIYLTDLYGAFPETKPPFKMIWASTSTIKQVPFGKLIHLNVY